MNKDSEVKTEDQSSTGVQDKHVSSLAQNPMLSAVYGRKINEWDLLLLDVKSNQFIKKYRDNLGLETPNNRIDTGDLRMITLALHEMGFSIVERLNK